MTHYRNFRINEKTNVRVPMMTNKGNYLAAADHELECDILQVGGLMPTGSFNCVAFRHITLTNRHANQRSRTMIMQTFSFSDPIHRKHQHAHCLAEEDHWHEDPGTGALSHCGQQVAPKHDKQVGSVIPTN